VLCSHELCASKNMCDDELCPSIEYKPMKLILWRGGGNNIKKHTEPLLVVVQRCAYKQIRRKLNPCSWLATRRKDKTSTHR
jgi:hypothetical protein